MRKLGYINRVAAPRLAALDAMALRFALADEREVLDWSLVPLKASINSSLCNLRANAASSSWIGTLLLIGFASLLDTLLTALISLPDDTLTGRVKLPCSRFWCSASLICNLIASGAGSSSSSSWLNNTLLLTATSLPDTRLLWFLELLLWKAFSGISRSASSRLFNAPVAFLASTSCGNRSWIVFQRTVFTVQDLPLLQMASSKTEIKPTSTLHYSNANPHFDQLEILAEIPYLISCLHLGHLFPHLSAADRKHFLQKLQTKQHYSWEASNTWRAYDPNPHCSSSNGIKINNCKR